jgi:hypothetical protein
VPTRFLPPYLAAQVLGAFIGVAASHLMFGEALLQFSHHIRAGGGQLFSEFVATFGLLCVIWGCAHLRSEAVPVAVGLYITGAYWFTASTSFANPAVTLAREFTDTFAGIRPADGPGFVVAQLRRFRRDCSLPLACASASFRRRKRLCFHMPILAVNDGLSFSVNSVLKSVRADCVLSPLHLKNGPDPERNTDQCDEDTAQYFSIPFEDAKPYTLQSRRRVDTQQHVGRDHADGEHDAHHHN